MSECAVCGGEAKFKILSTGDELCATCRANYRTLVASYKISDRETLVRSLSSRITPLKCAVPNPRRWSANPIRLGKRRPHQRFYTSKVIRVPRDQRLFGEYYKRILDADTGGRATVFGKTPAEVRKESLRTQRLMIKIPSAFKFTPPAERETPSKPYVTPGTGPLKAGENPWEPEDSLPKSYKSIAGMSEAGAVKEMVKEASAEEKAGAVEAGVNPMHVRGHPCKVCGKPSIGEVGGEALCGKHLAIAMKKQTGKFGLGGASAFQYNPLDVTVKGIPTSAVGAVMGNPEGPGAKFDHHRQIPPPCFHYDSFKTVPLRHTKYPRKGRYYVPGALAITGRVRKRCQKKFGEPGKRVKYLQWGIQSILTPKGAGLKATRGERAMENPVYYGVLAGKVQKFGKRFHSYSAWAKNKFGVSRNPSFSGFLATTFAALKRKKKKKDEPKKEEAPVAKEEEPDNLTLPGERPAGEEWWP
jgi:hypothetical protein